MFDFDMPPLDWRSATIPKKSGGVRHIRIPNPQLMEVQRQILQYLYLLYRAGKLEISGAAHGFVPFRNTCSSLTRHSLLSDVFLCCDVKDFFDSFPVGPVREKLLAAGIGPYLTNKILTACTFEGHFPQGSPASPWLTNVGMVDCDRMISAFAKRNGFLYTRYADDITLSVQPGVEDVDKKKWGHVFYQLEAILNTALGLRLKHRKDHVIIRGTRSKPKILGVVLRQDQLGYNADKRLRKNIRAAVHNLACKIRDAGGAIYPEDKTKWHHIYGSAQYMDYVRSFSQEGVNGADPVIGEDDFNYLLTKFKPIQ